MLNPINIQNYVKSNSKINFGAIKVSNCILKKCGLNKEYINLINENCPDGLDIAISNCKKISPYNEIAFTNVFYNGQLAYNKDFDILLYKKGCDKTKKRNKEQFISFINGIIEKFKLQSQQI